MPLVQHNISMLQSYASLSDLIGDTQYYADDAAPKTCFQIRNKRYNPADGDSDPGIVVFDPYTRIIWVNGIPYPDVERIMVRGEATHYSSQASNSVIAASSQTMLEQANNLNTTSGSISDSTIYRQSNRTLQRNTIINSSSTTSLNTQLGLANANEQPIAVLSLLQ